MIRVDDMKICVTGASGRIGKRMISLGCLPLYSDVTDRRALEVEIKHAKPDVVLHLAALTDVEFCEKKENTDKVIQVNVQGTSNVASVTGENACGMVFLSTDHIFNGKRGPYKESYKNYMPNWLGQVEKPVNFYGLTKLAAEGLVNSYLHTKIVRTSYLFDWDRMKYDESTYYPTFMYRSFMHVDNFAQALFEYLKRFYEMPQLLNIAGVDNVSWFQFAKEYWHGKKVLPRKHDLKDKFAPRPYKCGLDVTESKKLRLPQFSYKDGLQLL